MVVICCSVYSGFGVKGTNFNYLLKSVLKRDMDCVCVCVTALHVQPYYVSLFTSTWRTRITDSWQSLSFFSFFSLSLSLSLMCAGKKRDFPWGFPFAFKNSVLECLWIVWWEWMRIRELPKAEGIKIIVGFLMFVFVCIFWYLQNI